MRLKPRDIGPEKRKWTSPLPEITGVPEIIASWQSMIPNLGIPGTETDDDIKSEIEEHTSKSIQTSSTPTATDTAGIYYRPGPSRRPPYYNSKYPVTTGFPTPITSDTLKPTESNNRPGSSSPASSDDDGHRPPSAIFAAIGVVLVTLICVAVFTFLCLRKRKKRHQAQTTRGLPVQEMAKPQDQRPLVQSPYTVPLASSSTHPTIPPPQVPQPVILGPITPAGAWNTGIDTSDIVSMSDGPATANPFADENDPPPPYRPRSVVAPSRNASQRAPSTLGVITSSAEHHGEEARSPVSPLAGPHDDDDALSFLPATAPRTGV